MLATVLARTAFDTRDVVVFTMKYFPRFFKFFESAPSPNAELGVNVVSGALLSSKHARILAESK